MVNKPYRALDLCCKAGGITRGLQIAGFHVTGVDIEPQPRYVGDEFIQADALTVDLSGYDLICASPQCQGYGQSRFVVSCANRDYPKQIEDFRARLQATDAVWIIENVPGAPLINPVTICGTALGLNVRRHRLFESNIALFSPGQCRHGGNDFGIYANKVTRIGTHGKAYLASSGRTHYRPQTACKRDGQSAMGIDWMTLPEMCEAIPPAYSEYLGTQVIAYLDRINELAA